MNKIFFLLVFLPTMVFSQSKTITGSVTDDVGLPIPGVSILVKNTKNLGVATDFDGNFNITIPFNQTKILVFSYLGYTTQDATKRALSSIQKGINDMLVAKSSEPPSIYIPMVAGTIVVGRVPRIPPTIPPHLSMATVTKIATMPANRAARSTEYTNLFEMHSLYCCWQQFR